MLLVVIALIICLWFLIVPISVITLISSGPTLAITLLLIALIVRKLILSIGGADGNVHHIAAGRLLLLIRLLVIVKVRVGSLVVRVVGHATNILWLIVPITTSSAIPVVALFLIILWPEITDTVVCKHALLVCLRAKFTFVSTTILGRLPLHIWSLLIIVKVCLGVRLQFMRVRRV